MKERLTYSSTHGESHRTTVASKECVCPFHLPIPHILCPCSLQTDFSHDEIQSCCNFCGTDADDVVWASSISSWRLQTALVFSALTWMGCHQIRRSRAISIGMHEFQYLPHPPFPAPPFLGEPRRPVAAGATSREHHVASARTIMQASHHARATCNLCEHCRA